MKIVWISLISLISAVSCDDRARADGAVATLMKDYIPNTGVWKIAGGWVGANALTSIIDYMILTGSKQYLTDISNTFEKAKNTEGKKDYTNDYIDDCGWWALAWVRAYDLTHDRKYLQTAEHVADYMYSYRDNECKGGLFWSIKKQYKSSISNELFIKLAASLHNRIGGDTKYLNQAKEIWNWFKGSGLINKDHFVNDGVDPKVCTPKGQTYTYNQGVILGGLVELSKATNDHGYLTEAETIANAVTKSTFFNRDGILREPGEGDGCNGDGPSFKGAFIRNLGELSRALPNHPYHAYLEKNAESAYTHARNNNNQYDIHWTGPYKGTGGGCQHSAIDLMNAALKS